MLDIAFERDCCIALERNYCIAMEKRLVYCIGTRLLYCIGTSLLYCIGTPREVVGITVVVGCNCHRGSHGIREVWNSPVLISEKAAYKYTSVG